MYINPKTAIENGWITGVTDPDKQIQPNAIDFTLDKLFQIGEAEFVISEEGKQMRNSWQIEAAPDRGQDSDLAFWTIEPNSVYDGMSNIAVDLPEGVACELIIRSTLNRNGIFLTSGLYDSGYKGAIGFALHNRGALAKIAVGTRVGQIKFVSSDSAGLYAGGYNHEAGTHWTDNETEEFDASAEDKYIIRDGNEVD